VQFRQGIGIGAINYGTASMRDTKAGTVQACPGLACAKSVVFAVYRSGF
jgi:hypothetical protein